MPNPDKPETRRGGNLPPLRAVEGDRPYKNFAILHRILQIRPYQTPDVLAHSVSYVSDMPIIPHHTIIVNANICIVLFPNAIRKRDAKKRL